MRISAETGFLEENKQYSTRYGEGGGERDGGTKLHSNFPLCIVNILYQKSTTYASKVELKPFFILYIL